jgi:hypothetical protein
MITSILHHPFLLTLIIVWSLFWKGLALWKSAQQKHKAWFIVLLIVNTVGILEILYLYIFSKKLSPDNETI